MMINVQGLCHINDLLFIFSQIKESTSSCNASTSKSIVSFVLATFSIKYLDVYKRMMSPGLYILQTQTYTLRSPIISPKQVCAILENPTHPANIYYGFTEIRTNEFLFLQPEEL